VNKKPFIHPYIPNSVPEVKKKMLAEIGVKDIEELYEDIPPELRLKRDLNLPDPLLSKLELRRHMEAVLDRNISCAERSSFLGGGCARHYVPAICDEIAHRSEFLTAYAGEPYEDAGRFQVLFEYESLMAELLDFDVVNVPTYDCRYGTDLACGDIQGLGNHMFYGGSLGGFIATRDEEKFVMEYPSRLFSIAAAVYLVLMGPQGMRELGIHILQKARYAAMKLAEVPGATAPFAAGKRRIEQVRYSWEELTKETGVDTHQFALRMADFGFHLWSSHHPFLVPQPFTIEPTESYSKEELDEYVDGLRHVAEEARREPETVKSAPHRSVVHKIDESTFDDPAKWAITWRAYRKKHGNPAAEGGTK